ncbi:lysozyme inhibitor LprI family protein [Sulfuriroseicoccus oceanibius]|uniref:DUF1311 domain-containing protein n=1 Tax=Sulfuriroseicoccus oceanibius TaxID=2707525 RepID=A0A6B3L8J4_9BACT|nr:lysozyme inhibitor LprI family protein [Sulfuriroseicoccus oceanibius]QQL43764.1 DUF1311 domain-containing protein [Sulfuriroseicoccus oceanibius]
MKMNHWILAGGAVVMVGCSSPQPARVVPEEWPLFPSMLKYAEETAQEHIDTGMGMNGYAAQKAAIQDARLLIVYLELYDQLPSDKERQALVEEQTEWLRRREQQFKEDADPEGGSVAVLGQLGGQMSSTVERIDELQARLEKLKPE